MASITTLPLERQGKLSLYSLSATGPLFYPQSILLTSALMDAGVQEV
jgi:hypothetical protein